MRSPAALPLLGLVLMMALTLGGCVSQDPTEAVAPTSETRTVVQPRLAAEASDLRNPLRGYHQWRGSKGLTLGYVPLEAYERFEWRDLEPSPGVYDFSPIEAFRAKALSRGQRFAFRIRAMRGYDDNQVYVPAHWAQTGFWADVDGNPATRTWVPDWNHPPFLQAMRNLLAALGQKYNQDTKLAWVDIGLFGQYGEWYVKPDCYKQAPATIQPATESTRLALVDAHVQAFPERQLVAFMLRSQLPILRYAFAHPQAKRPIGLRCDAFGNAGWWSDQWGRFPKEWAEVSERWKVAPILGEQYLATPGSGSAQTLLSQAASLHLTTVGNGNFDPDSLVGFSTGEIQDYLAAGQAMGYRLMPQEIRYTSSPKAGDTCSIDIRWRNLGSAPPYESMNLFLEVSRGTSVLHRQSLTFRPELLLPGQDLTWTDAFTLPLGLPRGSCALHLVLRPALNPQSPIQFPVQGQGQDGRLPVGTLFVR